jgi:hypothetical protein
MWSVWGNSWCNQAFNRYCRSNITRGVLMENRVWYYQEFPSSTLQSTFSESLCEVFGGTLGVIKHLLVFYHVWFQAHVWFYHGFPTSTSRCTFESTIVKCLGELSVPPSFTQSQPKTRREDQYKSCLVLPWVSYKHFTRHYFKRHCEVFGGTLGAIKL